MLRVAQLLVPTYPKCANHDNLNGCQYLIIIKHESVTYDMKQNLERFYSDTIANLQEQMDLIYCSNNDENNDDLGQRSWQKALLVKATNEAELKNVILFLDAYTQWRRDNDGRSRIPTDVKICIENFSGLPLHFEVGEGNHTIEVTEHANASNIKAILTQQPPVRSRRMLIVDLDFERKGYVQMGFDGETYKS